MGKDESLQHVRTLIQHDFERLDVHKEAETLMLGFQHPRSLFEVNVHAKPTLEIFDDCMYGSRDQNVRVVHLAGHSTSRCGFAWRKEGSTEYQEVSILDFAGRFRPEVPHKGGTVECVVLNACESEEMGKKLLEYGVPHVVCWRSEVRDVTAMKFSEAFYKALDRQSDGRRDYRRAFEQAEARLSRQGAGDANSGSSERKPAKHLAKGAVDFVCLLSKDGRDLFPDTGFIRSDDDESTRNWRVPGTLADGTKVDPATDYAALAGKAERECMELLGFPMTLPGKREPIKVGDGIERNGFIKDQRVLRMWGVTSYTSGVWGRGNKAIQNARGKSPDQIRNAIEKLEEVEQHRKEDMRKHGGGNSQHKHQLKQIIDTREALERMVPPMSVTRGVSLGASARLSSSEEGTITEAHASSIGVHPGPVGSRLVTVAGLAVVVAAIITFNVMKRR